MSSRTRAILVALGVLALLGFAYSPLLRAGLLGNDFAVLLRSSETPLVTAGGSIPEGEAPIAGSYLGQRSLWLSQKLWGIAGPGAFGLPPAALYRLENLALLVLGAIGLGSFVRRLFLPWTGSEQARAAARAFALILAVHPLSTFAVATLAARGTLLGFCLASWSAAAFLRGRQEHRIAFTAVGLGLCILAGFAADLALGLPLLLVGAELTSAHRYRPQQVRLRTAATTLVVFGAGASIDLLLRLSRFGLDALPPGVSALLSVEEGSQAATLFTRSVEKLGLLVLPSNPYVLGVTGTVVAGVLFLVAMQPALGAARSAPRLWGWFLFLWFLALLAAELSHAHVRLSPRHLEHVDLLLPSTAVMAMGLALGTTAQSGLRRTLFAPLVCAGYSVLAHGCTLPWIAAAGEVEALRTEMLGALELYGTDASVLVVDPPRESAGLDPVGGFLAGLVDPRLEGRRRGPASDAPLIIALERPALLAFMREPEFDALRRRTLVALVPPAALADPHDLEPVPNRRPRRTLLIKPESPSGPVRSWRGDSRSPALDAEASAFEALRIRLPAGTELDTKGRMRWRARDVATAEGSLGGALVPEGDEPVMVFELGSSLAWMLGGRVRLIWFEGGILSLSQANLVERLPEVPFAGPSIEGEDWYFERSGDVADVVEGGILVLGILDLADHTYRELEVRRRASGRLRVRDAQILIEERTAAGGGPFAWYLDYRAGGTTIARLRGRHPAAGGVRNP